MPIGNLSQSEQHHRDIPSTYQPYTGQKKDQYSHPEKASRTEKVTKKQRREREAEEPLWRHTIGRISCAARPPIYLAAVAGQVVKMGLKTIWSTGQLAVNGVISGCNLIDRKVFGSEQEYSKLKVELNPNWTFKGVARDGIMTIHLLQKTVNAAWCTVVAPPDYYSSFAEAVKGSVSKVFRGHYHKEKSESQPVAKLWQLVKDLTPNYKQQIFTHLRGNNGGAGFDTSRVWDSA